MDVERFTNTIQGAYYHVTSRGNERKAIFRNKGDRESFLSYLKSAHLRYGAVIHVYCLVCSIESIYYQVKLLLDDSESVARKAAIFLCHKYTGTSLNEIGAYFGISDSGVSLASHRFSATLKRNRKLRKKIGEIQSQLNL